VNLKITENDFIRMFRLQDRGVPSLARILFDKLNLTYRLAEREDWNEYIQMYRDLEQKKSIMRSKEENLLAFERGWSENLEELLNTSPDNYENALKPKYFRGSKFFRYDGNLVVTNNYQLEYELFLIARFCLFHAYLGNSDRIYEVGCGSCANLLLLSQAIPQASLVGLDWTEASGRIAVELGRKLSLSIGGQRFDMLNPDYSFKIPLSSAIITIHAFEQLGQSYEPILEYILNASPSIVMQYEPVLEFYDQNKLFDSLALSYCQRRGYLQGYYSKLRQLENKGRIKIIAAYRPGLGGILHEQSVLVWRPC